MAGQHRKNSMRTYKTKLKSRFEVAEHTMAFRLEKPPGFQFKPGQSLDLMLIDPPETDSEGAVRTFSIASAPYEDDLLIAMHLRDSAFERVFATMPLDKELKFDGPVGSFTLHESPAKAAVFLASGIGITPVRSILRHAEKEKLPHQLYLFYVNRRPEDAAFLAELQDLSKSNPRFIFIPSMTEMERSKRNWLGNQGPIDREMLADHFCDLNGPVYYIAGPPVMVAAVQQILIKADVNKDDIRTEEFTR